MSGHVYGLDPSYKKFGLADIDREGRRISLAYYTTTFSRQFGEAALHAYDLVEVVVAQIESESIISIESPIMQAQMAGGELSCLQGMVYQRLRDAHCVIEYHPPHTLDCLMGKGRGERQKRDSVEWAKARLDLLESSGWAIEGRWRKPCERGADDRAEAFIYACLMCDRIGWQT